MTSLDESAFWQVAAPYLERPGVTRSTMMGYPCLRLHGDFFASWDPHHLQLVAKLDRIAATNMIDTAQAEAFAPSGKRFREWVAVPIDNRDRWETILEAAFGHALRRSE